MDKINSQEINDEIKKMLINKTADFENRRNQADVEFTDKQLMFEQYKLLIDSSHKIDERRGNSNNFFVSINTIFISFLLSNSTKLKDLDTIYIPFLELLVLVGIIIAWYWLRVINSYKKLNYVNYSLIQALEKLLPTFTFSLRGKIEADQDDNQASNRANIILIKENILPKLFLFIYILCFLSILYLHFINF